MNRKIEINISVPDCHQLREALKYLCSWSLCGYDSVLICDDFPLAGKDIIANYKNSLNGSGYVIGAIWQEEKQNYSFHS
jgi:hypothetical protein